MKNKIIPFPITYQQLKEILNQVQFFNVSIIVLEEGILVEQLDE